MYLILFTISFLATCDRNEAWVNSLSSTTRQRMLHTKQFFFKDLLERAFENDDSLSQDEKLMGQIEGPNENYYDSNDNVGRRSRSLTETQQKWRQMNSKTPDFSGKSFDFDFYLTGVPEKDPSNDLFGAKVNISSRDRQLGQALPQSPTVSNIRVQFLDMNNKCICETDSSFTELGTEGDWKMSEDGRQVRFRIPVKGFTRIVETRGTIQSVAWSDEPSKERKASTQYTIPQGWMYGEAEVSCSAQTGSSIAWKNCILKIEKAVGVLGAGSRMAPCGKFEARSVATSANLESKVEMRGSL